MSYEELISFAGAGIGNRKIVLFSSGNLEKSDSMCFKNLPSDGIKTFVENTVAFSCEDLSAAFSEAILRNIVFYLYSIFSDFIVFLWDQI